MSKENKTYYDYLFEQSDEEKRINEELKDEYERFRDTEAYKEHHKKIDELHDKLVAAGEVRRMEARKHKPQRLSPAKIDMEKFKAEQEQKEKERFDGFPEELKEAINAYNNLDENEKRKFQTETWCWHRDYEDYKNPQTTQEDLSQLMQILVQETIDFIRERGLKDIDSIGFGIDSLQESAKHGEWIAASDGNIYATGIGMAVGKDGKEYPVVQQIGECM